MRARPKSGTGAGPGLGPKQPMVYGGFMSTPNPVDLVSRLRQRFEENMPRHRGLRWADVEARLQANPAKIRSLQAMEESGGEPDVTGRDKETGEFLFTDCAPESPAGRRSLCFDGPARLGRKEHPPRGSAAEMADAMGAALLTEREYRDLQKLGEFDRKTSSWVQTPAEIRDLGGALFCDRRYNQVFVYHNGADSYYASRGFRARLRV